MDGAVVDFTIPPDLEELRRRVATFVRDEVLPAEADLDEESPEDVPEPLRKRAREAGLWTPHLPPEWGGLGVGPLGMALISQEYGASALASLALNAVAPDEGNMHLLLHAGTDAQKEPRLPGSSSREDLVRRYAERSGRPVGDLHWYEVLATWKLAILLEGSHARHLAGTTDDPLFAQLERGVPALARRALEVAGTG